MMMGNMGEVATLTDRLAMMPDNMLPRLAQQYKSDAITLSLILGEKNRRERVRSSMKAQAGAQPQPKVNDQVVASMQPQLPEQVGIGALPAPNMQQMADGGIAGYADGDLVYHNEPVVRMAEGGVARYQAGGTISPQLMAQYNREMEEMGYGQRVQFSPEVKSVVDQIQNAQQAQYLQQEQQRMLAGGRELAKPGMQLQSGAGPTIVSEVPAGGPELPRGIAGSRVYRDETPAAAPKAGAAPKTDAGSKTAADRGTKTASGTGIAAIAPGKDVFSMDSLRAAQREAGAGSDYEIGALRNQLVGMRADLEKRAEDRLAARKKEIEQEGDVFKGREERIAKREQALETEKGRNTGLALLEAGLAIMSTPGHWSQAVGKGAQVGTARYASGLDKLRAAQEKLEDARDRTEELRLNRSDMNKREIRQLERERDADVQKGQELMFGFAKDIYGMDRQDARELTKMYTEGQFRKADIASRERIAGAELASRERIAAMPTGELRGVMMLGTGKTDAERYESGLRKMQEITADKSGMKAVEVLARINAEERKNMEPLTSMQDLLMMARQYSALNFPKVGDNAPTRERPPR